MKLNRGRPAQAECCVSAVQVLVCSVSDSGPPKNGSRRNARRVEVTSHRRRNARLCARPTTDAWEARTRQTRLERLAVSMPCPVHSGRGGHRHTRQQRATYNPTASSAAMPSKMAINNSSMPAKYCRERRDTIGISDSGVPCASLLKRWNGCEEIGQLCPAPSYNAANRTQSSCSHALAGSAARAPAFWKVAALQSCR